MPSNCLILEVWQVSTFVHMIGACLVWGHREEFGTEPCKAMVLFSKARAVGVGARKSQHPLGFLQSLSWGPVEC